jgi:zinc finger protein
VKPGGSISAKARRVSLRVKGREDLKRDVMKSDTAGCSIPEIELELTPGTLGGKYTSLEGLLNDIREQIQKVNQFHLGDSGVDDRKEKMVDFMTKFDQVYYHHYCYHTHISTASSDMI